MLNLFAPFKQKRGLWLLGILLALTIPATIPFWQPDFFIAADSPLHLWRVFELDRMLRAGVFYPRWASDLFFGYGYPVFNFYPPLAYYLTESLHLFGLDIAVAIKFEFALTVLIAEAGMFLLSRDVFDDALSEPWQKNAAGILSAVAFAYAPYFLIDVYIRGAIAETLGLAFLPLFFWSLRRVLAKPTIAGALVGGICGALLLLSHNLTAFFAAPVLAIYVLLRILAAPDRSLRVKALACAVGVAALALALSAFYWLPALLELRMVYIGQPALIQPQLHKTILEHFKTIWNVVQPQFFYDYPEAAFPLGAAWVVLALVGWASSLVFLGKHTRIEMIFFGVVSFIAGFGLLDVSRPLWQSLPALWVIQFTWRLTVFICVSGALAIGGWALLLQRLPLVRFVRAGAVLALILVLILSAMWNARAKPWYAPMPSASDPQVLARYESNSNAFGMSSENEYLPAWVKLLPNPVTPNVRVLKVTDTAFANAQPLDLQFQNIQPASWQFHVNASQAAPLTWRAFYYPDWYAWIDNQPAALRASTNLGLLTLDIPPGAHDILVTHASLPVRDVADSLTLLGLIVVTGWSIAARRRGVRGWRLPLALLGTAVLFFAVPQLVAIGAQPPPIANVNVQVDDSLRLLGWSSERTSPPALKLGFIWQATRLMPEKLPTHIQLVDAQGKVWSSLAQFARYSVGDERYWIPNELAPDIYDLFIPADLPAGQFTVQVARGDSSSVNVGTLALAHGGAADPLPPVTAPLDARLGDSIHLLGANVSLTNVRAGDSVPLTLFWRTDRSWTEDLSVFVHLLDRDGKLGAQQDSLSNNGFSPTTLWAPGSVIADHHTLQLPTTLHPGHYQLVTGLYHFKNVQRLPVFIGGAPSEDDFVSLGEVKIPADRPFTPTQRVQNEFGPAIELRGMTLNALDRNGAVSSTASGALPAALSTSARSTLQLTLEWFAQQAVPAEYTVYAHLVDANGALVKQQDNPPVHGYYPTTLWQPGERIVDDYELDLKSLPAGTYTLLVGMYESSTGTRLPATDSGGAELANRELQIAHITIAP